jgi:hypothetical protein
MAAFRQFLGVDQESDSEVVAGHRPAVAPVIAALECATGRTCGPAYCGRLFLIRMAASWRQNRDDGEREDCPEQTRGHEMLSVSLLSGQSHRVRVTLGDRIRARKCVKFKLVGRVAQLVEHRPFKAWVAGSSPAALTKSF